MYNNFVSPTNMTFDGLWRCPRKRAAAQYADEAAFWTYGHQQLPLHIARMIFNAEWEGENRCTPHR